ncbi:MAG: carboxymuconolactone decarboxylase family protein [Bacteroidota bacterium]
MRTFEVPTKENAPEASKAIFENLEKQVGMVPNLFATIGYSSNALSNYLTFQGGQAKGAFNAKEREAVFLAVSQVNDCRYCLAAHTALGKMSGFSEEETLKLRDGSIEDEKLSVLTQLAANITENRGRADEGLVEKFFALGFDNAALIDLVSLVADKTLANYVHNLTQVPVDFPEAKELVEA